MRVPQCPSVRPARRWRSATRTSGSCLRVRDATTPPRLPSWSSGSSTGSWPSCTTSSAATHEAEDLAQEVFLRVYRHRKKYRPEGEVQHLALHHCQQPRPERAPRPQAAAGAAAGGARERHRSGRARPDNAGPDPRRPAVHNLAATRTRRNVIRRALDGLSERQRVAIVLNKFEDMNYADIAEVMGLSAKAVKSLLSRARVQAAARRSRATSTWTATRPPRPPRVRDRKNSRKKPLAKVVPAAEGNIGNTQWPSDTDHRRRRPGRPTRSRPSWSRTSTANSTRSRPARSRRGWPRDPVLPPTRRVAAELKKAFDAARLPAQAGAVAHLHDAHAGQDCPRSKSGPGLGSRRGCANPARPRRPGLARSRS